jgi:hypothetical protein
MRYCNAGPACAILYYTYFICLIRNQLTIALHPFFISSVNSWLKEPFEEWGSFNFFLMMIWAGDHSYSSQNRLHLTN